MDSKNGRHIGRMWGSIRARGFMVPLAAVLIVVAIFGFADAIILWRFYRGGISASRAPVYASILSALGSFTAALAAIIAILRNELLIERKAHDDVRPAIDVRVCWQLNQIMFEMANEAEHPALSFLVVLEQDHPTKRSKLPEWLDPRTTTLRPFPVEGRWQHYHSAGTMLAVKNMSRMAHPSEADIPDPSPMEAVRDFAPAIIVQVAETLRLVIIYRDVLNAWWKLERSITLGISPRLPGIYENATTALDMGTPVRISGDPYPDLRWL